MNVSTNIRPDTVSPATLRNNAPDSSDRAEPGVQEQSRPRSIYDSTDTVEISDRAREILNGKDPFALPYDKEDLAPLKARFSKFHEIESSIHTRLASLLTKQGFTTGMLDQVKVEIDSNGRAIVGGIDDVKAARALEKAINSDKSLLKDIVVYQKEERRLSLDLRKTTGMSLNDYASHIGTLDKMGEKIFLEEENVDPEFAAMLGEQYTDDTVAVNITGQHNILENAEDTVNGMMRAVTGKVEEAFREMNADIQQSGGDPQEIEDSLVNLKRLKISVDNTGGVTIEGTASKENPGTDRAAKKIINKQIENRSIEDAREEAAIFATDPVKRLKGLMANMDVLRPGGASLLQRAEPPET